MSVEGLCYTSKELSMRDHSMPERRRNAITTGLSQKRVRYSCLMQSTTKGLTLRVSSRCFRIHIGYLVESAGTSTTHQIESPIIWPAGDEVNLSTNEYNLFRRAPRRDSARSIVRKYRLKMFCRQLSTPPLRAPFLISSQNQSLEICPRQTQTFAFCVQRSDPYTDHHGGPRRRRGCCQNIH